MFGGHDDNAARPQDANAPAGQPTGDSALHGVSDLADNGSPAQSGAYDNDAGFLPTPGDPSVAAPAAATSPATDTVDDTAAPSPTPMDSGNDDLLTIKQQALQSLSPLVGHLDQTPEEKFRTTMMMIQASDNQALIKDAYEAAQQISDEKARAQALLDIVNEINYFTQGKQQA